MKKSVLTALVTACALFAGHAFAANAECEAKAAEKKLAGAAKTSFIKKCKADACTGKAVSKDGKPLSGAAKDAVMKKCEADA
jgi:hypothetical protein